MDINEEMIKEEVSNFVSSLQKLLPKKKDFIVGHVHEKPKMTRLSDVHIEAKRAFPKCFVGTKLVVIRDILDKVKLTQQYNFGNMKDSHKCYTQVLHKEMEPKTVEDGLTIDSSGSAVASYTEKLDDTHQLRLTSKIKDYISSETEVTLEKETDNSIGSVSCTITDVDPNTLKLVTQGMYKILPEFSIGTEVSFKPLSYPIPDLSISGRYERSSFTLSSTVSKAGLQVCLSKQFAPDLHLASIIHEGTTGSTSLGIALHKSYPSGSELKIFVDSERCGGFTMQKDVLFHEPGNEVRVLRLIGSTLIDRQRRVRFGFGFHLDF